MWLLFSCLCFSGWSFNTTDVLLLQTCSHYNLMLVLFKFLFSQVNDIESRSMKMLKYCCKCLLYKDCSALWGQ